ncbi:ABC transporter ATP-binding protein [Corynebacterium suedekumii]|nr:ABC transporter ATP-binding protein [Corynebacterium suedekumii]
MSTFATGRGLQLGYERVTAVAPSDFHIPAGKLTAIIGPNGSGKSTLLHALGGLIEPQDGHLEVLGGTPEAAKSRVSYVMQSVALPRGRAPVGAGGGEDGALPVQRLVRPFLRRRPRPRRPGDGPPAGDRPGQAAPGGTLRRPASARVRGAGPGPGP